MKNKNLEQIANLIVECEALAETQEEFNMLHDIYLDAQRVYYLKNHRYLHIKEYQSKKLTKRNGDENSLN